jgi:p-aminobenzoyl-glutamate transporter AbgT
MGQKRIGAHQTMKPSGVAIILASLAAVIQPFAPLWLFLACIIGSMLSTAIGLILMKRAERRRKLIAAMDAAFLPKPATTPHKGSLKSVM